jgi:hypothetical protein
MSNEKITTGATQVRALANNIPWWHTNTINGHGVLAGHGIHAEFRGDWAPNLRRFFNAVDRATLLNLAVLLEACSSSGVPRRIVEAAERLAGHFDVDDESHPEPKGLTFR